ncbi:septum site-determining protein MinC [Agathobacter sp.]
MSQSVTIKSNKYGINLVLNAEVAFDELLKDVIEKFKASANFFKNAKLALSFEGRELSEDEEQQIIAAIEDNTTIEILCIVENGTKQEAVMKENVEAFYDAVQQQYENAIAQNQMPENVNVPDQFYRGTLRSGQVISSDSSVTIIGDVNPGAKIIAQGNIVILGALKGNAHAGCTGDRSCFIFALDMQPIQIQIGDLIAKSPDKPEPKRRARRKEKTSEAEAQIAIAKDGNIYIEPITKNILNNI